MNTAVAQFTLSQVQRDLYFDQLHMQGTSKYTIGGYIDIAQADTQLLVKAHKAVIRAHQMFLLRLHHTVTGPELWSDRAGTCFD